MTSQLLLLLAYVKGVVKSISFIKNTVTFFTVNKVKFFTVFYLRLISFGVKTVI